MNKNIIIIILAIIVVAAVGFMLFSHPANGKINTQVNFLNENSLKNGDQIQFELKDAQGNAVAGQNITIAYDDGSGNVQNYNIVTDSIGKGYLTLSGEDAGKYDVTVTYNGDDKYNGCSAKQTITIEEGTSEAPAESGDTNSSANTVLYNNGTSTTSSNNTTAGGEHLNYDSKYGYYYNDNGIIRGGQSDGMNAYELRKAYESGNMIDEEGNLQ